MKNKVTQFKTKPTYDDLILFYLVRFLLLILLLNLPACWGGSPSIYYTLLTPPVLSTQANSTPKMNTSSLGVGPLTLPEHLDRPHLVTREGQHTLKVHTRHRWSASLGNQLLNQLESSLMTQLNDQVIISYPWERSWRPTRQFMVDVKSLEGSMGEQVYAEFVWRIIEIKSDRVLHQGRFKTQSSARPKKGETVEAAYVRAMAETLSNFTKELSHLIRNQ